MRGITGLLVALAVMVLAGCATPMSPTKADKSLDLSQKSVALLSLRVDHAVRPAAKARPIFVVIENLQKPGERQVFGFDADANISGAASVEYLIRVPLAPGKYRLNHIHGQGHGIPLMVGTFIMHLRSEFEVPANSVVYLGRVDGVTRDRQEGEFRAGPVIPLIDQAATGFSKSTWEILIQDAYEADAMRFRSNFPALEKVDIKKNVLPAFDRAKVTEWWQKNG